MRRVHLLQGRAPSRLLLLPVTLTIVGLAAWAGGSATASRSSAAGLPSQITFGVKSALTGGIAPYDTPALQGFRMAIDEINAKGGIAGKTKIKLQIRNNRSDAAESAKISQTFVSDKVQFEVLPADPSTAIPAGRLAQQAHIPMMSILTSPPSARTGIGDYYFSNASEDNMAAAGLAKYAYQQGVRRVYVIIGPDSAYTTELPRYFEQAFKKFGGTVVAEDTYRTGTQDFGAQITKIRNQKPKPQAIMTSMYEPEFPAFLKQLRAAGVKLPFYESDAIDTPSILALGKLISGTHAVTYGFPTPGDSLSKYYVRFKKKYGHQPESVWPAIGYDAAYIIADAFKRAGTTEGSAVRDAINSTRNFPGVVGKTTFGSLPGYPLRPVTVQLWTVKPDSTKVTRVLVAKIALKAQDIPK
jgi:branched-chain amino acid transport system substrate-binding protein